MNKKTRFLNALDFFREPEVKKERWTPLGLFLSFAVAAGVIAYTVVIAINYVKQPTVSSYTEPIEGQRM